MKYRVVLNYDVEVKAAEDFDTQAPNSELRYTAELTETNRPTMLDLMGAVYKSHVGDTQTLSDDYRFAFDVEEISMQVQVFPEGLNPHFVLTVRQLIDEYISEAVEHEDLLVRITAEEADRLHDFVTYIEHIGEFEDPVARAQRLQAHELEHGEIARQLLEQDHLD